MYKRIFLVVWFIGACTFLYELYTYAFVHGMGLLPALQMFGEVLQNFFMQTGPFAPLLFIGLYAIRPLVLFPASIVTMTSVFVFGLYGGFVVSYVGEILSASVAFFAARYFADSLHLAHKVRTSKIGAYFTENAFTSVAGLRLVPIFPFDFVNYASGVMNIPFRTYLVATMLGILPGFSAYIFLGYSLMHTQYLLYAIGLLMILFIITSASKYKRTKRV
jgi:uncharacterized membrane protein YdjX (TVP38/TMEM64 family)